MGNITHIVAQVRMRVYTFYQNVKFYVLAWVLFNGFAAFVLIDDGRRFGGYSFLAVLGLLNGLILLMILGAFVKHWLAEMFRHRKGGAK
jgi:hypothetical protein